MSIKGTTLNFSPLTIKITQIYLGFHKTKGLIQKSKILKI